MLHPKSYSPTYQTRLSVWLFPVALLFVTMACSMPALFRRATPTPTTTPAPTSTPALPTPTPQPLPPAVVETDPMTGVELGLNGSIILYFNQPMDRLSVESALKSQTSLVGSYTWIDDTTLVFTPDQPLPPESDVALELGTQVRSGQGLALAAPVSYKFRTVGYLRLANSLPESDTSDVNPTSAVVAAFNYPVVPLGAEPAGLPVGFTLEPAAEGKGEWLNTSTYIFYPEPALEGGKTYTVQVNPELRGSDGSPLQAAESWAFSTAAPRLVTVDPSTETGPYRLDSKLVLTFNQPMDPASVESHFSLLGPDNLPVSGQFSWDERNTVMTFAPDNLLERGAAYTISLGGEAQARGGTPLGSSFEAYVMTVPQLAVTNSNPQNGGVKKTYEAVYLNFSAPVGTDDVKPYITVTPSVTNQQSWYSDYDRSISVVGDFLPETDYSVRVAPNLPDPWGGTLGEEYVLNFRTEALPPSVFITSGSDVLFLTPRDTFVPAQATNFNTVPMFMGSTPLPDFIDMISSDNSYNIRQSYSSSDERSWTQSLDVTPNQMQEVPLSITPDQSTLDPGLYYLKIDLPQDQSNQQVNLIVVSNVNMTFKLSATEALVWAVDLRNNKPVRDASISILDKNGQLLASGRTDEQGIFSGGIPAQQDMYSIYYAVLGLPGEDGFSMALSTWNMGTSPWDFGINADFSGPALKAYLYTDRPIYRPGQTVYFRGIVRQAYNGRYTLPDTGSLPLTLYKNYSEEIASFELPLSAYGTVHGEYTLPADAQPGDYRLASKTNEFGITVNFKVAEYRKPEINLQVDLTGDQPLAGETLTAQVNARYFFDAPAGNVPLHWTLLEENAPFYLPDYQVGVEDTRWLNAFYFPQFGGPSWVEDGNAITDPQGKLSLEVDTKPADSRKRYILEVTLTDESGFPVSARDSIEVNPAQYYVGVRPDAWVGRSGQEAGFDILVVDWDKEPAGSHNLRAEFQKVTWVRDESKVTDPRYISPEFIPQYTAVASTDFQTGADGKARLAFTPPEPGTYQLDVSGEGTRTQLTLWVGGQGQVIWPNLPNQRLRLTADRQNYKPGDTAQVFIPSPYNVDSPGLVTVERGTMLRQQVETIPAGGGTINLPLSSEDAPNVFLSVTILGQNEQGYPDYHQGYLEIPVAPSEQTLNVALTSQPERAGPGEEVTLDVQVTDNSGKPVQGEFSLSLVDLAVLALADPNAPDIVPAFYGEQPLGVRTGLPLSVYPQLESIQPGGGGGGGDGLVQVFTREKFPDTAYWNAEIITDANGRAQVNVTLPDNLTTWQASTRDVTQDTRVGQSDASIITTKDLLVRPVVPRFLVVGDHVQLAAVVQNNTPEALQVTASLQANGLILDDPAAALLQLDVPANGRQRVEWWGAVQDVDSVDLTFSTSGGDGLQDAIRPAGGQIPVLHYSAPQTFATAGTLDEGGKRIELVSLPRSFDPQGGTLRLELSSSLAGSFFSALDVLETYPYECTEQTLSRFLPNLELYRVLQDNGIQSPETQSRLERTLGEGLEQLQAYQNQDGGWSWWQGGESDQFVTAYALFGLVRARAAGSQVSEDSIQRAINYLNAALISPQSLADAWQLDRLAFVNFVLTEAGSGSPAEADALFQMRDQLSPWGQALLALTLNRNSPGSEATRTLVADLEASAVRSATGAHWEEQEPSYINMSTPISTSSVVVYALAQLDPKSPVLVDAMRYLMSNRQADGAWGSTYSTAWTVMAGAEYLRATGELAGDFMYSAELNSLPLSSGQAGGDGAPVSSEVPVEKLYPEYPNALSIQRADGAGRLYYTAALNVNRPVEEAAPLDRGISITRAYYPYGEACVGVEDCAAISEARAGDLVIVRLTLTLKNPAYYLLVEDYLPAGTEILNTGLKTTQQALLPEDQPRPLYDPEHPYDQGWGWWLFSAPRIFDDHIAWAVDYLPAGTYELTYYLSVLQSGEYRVLPARAWQFYFPDVQGNSSGELFAIKPSN